MARLTAKDGVVEIVPSDSGIKVLKEKDGVKTIEVDTPFKKKQKAISVDEFKAKKPKPKQEPQYPRNRKQREGGLDPSDITENLQQGKPEPIRPPQAKGIRKALRGGGRAYGQNS